MRILCIICKNDEYLLWISEDNSLLYSSTFKNIHGYNNNLVINNILSFLQENNISLHNLDFISIATNPKSYTGIRVIYSFIIGLSYSLNIKIIEINLLEIYLHLLKKKLKDIDNKYLCVLLNAINNNFYTLSSYNDKPVLYGKYNSEFLQKEFDKYKSNTVIITDNEKLFLNYKNIYIKKNDNNKIMSLALYLALSKIKDSVFVNINCLNIAYF
jgi:tRNA A37 threonylcarbamoyladenosine modification protein TsaB